MKYCIVDIGSNSVRLALIEDGITKYKKVQITRLAENLGKGLFLSKKAMDRTVKVVCSFVEKAKKEQPESIYIFATAAVRNANNGNVFCQQVKSKCDIKVDIVSGEVEGLLGVKGALSGVLKGGLIDIGGASTEIAYLSKDNFISKSFPIGVVTLTEKMKNANAINILNEVFNEVDTDILDNDFRDNFYIIGGTATNIVALILGLVRYDAKKVHHFILEREKVILLKEKLSKLSIEEISKLSGIQKGREEVIYAGAIILCYLFEKLRLDKIIVSESDNLEGYLTYILERK